MIARVFPRKTAMTPTDPDVYIGEPTIFTPHYNEVHISVAFTWDKPEAERLLPLWKDCADKVLIGGPAYNDPGGEFTPGRYVKHGALMTSRGCPNKCSFCYVPKREGALRELTIHSGNNILDNNLLACSDMHIDQVFAMLKTQKAVQFTGGLEAARVTDRIVDLLRGISLNQLFLAYDNTARRKYVAKAAEKLSKYFPMVKLRCYVLIGYGNDTLDAAEGRLHDAARMGLLPYAMLYRDDGGVVQNTPKWRQLKKLWSRPAATKKIIQNLLAK